MSQVERTGAQASGGNGVRRLIAIMGLLWACGPTTGTSTETGNPPVIRAARVSLYASGAQVHVIGGDGAVSPGGSTVRVANLANDAKASGHASGSGAFDIAIEGTLQDDYRLVATRDGAMSDPVVIAGRSSFVDGGAESLDGAVAAGGDGATRDASTQTLCAELYNETLYTLSDAAQRADRACQDQTQCVLAAWVPSCMPSCGAQALVSQTGGAELAAAVSAAQDDACVQLAALGCEIPAPSCAASAQRVSCYQGMCAKAADCEGCGAECALPFDDGGTAASPQKVYFHDPLSGACVPRAFGGSGGNANRFASLAQCQSACPMPTACSDERLKIAVCLECGAPGGCADLREVCALGCVDDADCEHETLGASAAATRCEQGVCQPPACL